MHQYMIDINLPSYFDEEFISLIPSQRNLVDRLMQQGVLESYSLALDNSKLWITLNSKSESNVVKLMKTFPLIKYMKYTIFKLAFHNQASLKFPNLSLN